MGVPVGEGAARMLLGRYTVMFLPGLYRRMSFGTSRVGTRRRRTSSLLTCLFRRRPEEDQQLADGARETEQHR